MSQFLKGLAVIAFLATSLHAVNCQQTQKVQSFAERFYTVVLDRTADNVGLDSWTNNLTSGTFTGADVANGFIFSDEFINKNKSNEAYITILYRAFFNREPDVGGFNEWINQLTNGTSREDVLQGFLYSQEFVNLSNSYGIKAYAGASYVNASLTDFVERFYTVIFGRASDEDGLNYWTHRLSTGAATGADIAYGFIFSAEYNEVSKDNATYLTDLYRAFFNREADTLGFNGWIDLLNQGMSRRDVLEGFLGAPEFINLANDFGILAFEGAPTASPSNNVAPTANAGVDQSANFAAPVILDASNSTDPDGSIACYWWSEEGILLNESDTFTKDDFNLGKHNIRLTVVDNDNAIATNSIEINVLNIATPSPTPSPTPEGYASLGAYTPKLYTNNKTGNNRYIAYYPENAISADMPVVMFIKGGGSATIESYRGIMKFMASKGYYVIGVDTNSYASRYVTQKLEIALNEVKERDGLTVSKLAIMGHSLGGGQAFYAMKKFRDDGYGNEGNLALSIDGWFAFNMNQIDLNLLDTKVSFLQMNGVHGTGTDPRIDLKIWNLAKQADKSFYTLPSTNHSYVAGDLANVLGKEDLLFSIGALTDDAFKGVNDGATAIPEANKATYSDIVNALQAEDTYHSGDCKGKQYNAISVIQNNNINYCDFEASYPPEANLTKIVVDTVDRPLEKFSSYLDVTFDNTVERNVTRVTDREQDNKNFNGHQYPKQGSAWNSDMSLVRLIGRVYDAETLKEIPLTKDKTGGEVYSLMKAPESGSSGIRWSKFDPNILYVMSAEKKFYKLTISPDKTTMTEEVIIDLSASERPFFNIGQNEGNIDYEDKYVVLTSLDGNDTYAALLDIKAKSLVWGPLKLDIPRSDFDWMSISPSGNYILISANSNIKLYNRNLGFIRVLANRAEHGDIGYDQNGNEMYVQFHSGGVGIFGFVLNDSPDYIEPIELLDSNYGGGHISCRNYKRKGWCYVSTRADGYREVYALKLDGSKTVQRFAKTNARGPEDPRLGDDTHYYYATYPTAVPSPYGSRVLFWSDYGNAEGFLYYYKGDDDRWHTTDHYHNRDTYQVRISK